MLERTITYVPETEIQTKTSGWRRYALIAGALAAGVFLYSRARQRGAVSGVVNLRADADIRYQVRDLVEGIVASPELISVHVKNGIVRLDGEIAPGEVERLREDLRHVNGVLEVVSHLEVRHALVGDDAMVPVTEILAPNSL